MERPTFQIQAQPDDSSCGPTCLQAIYQYYNDRLPIGDVIRDAPSLSAGGTLAVMLACHALQRGYRARIYTYNLQVFDPTWFTAEADLAERLRTQMDHKRDEKLREASHAYLRFLQLGGEVRFEELNARLLRRHLKHGTPILTGLSATYLYHGMRERNTDCQPDDIQGEPVGHFVVLCDYDVQTRRVHIADPYRPNPMADGQHYSVTLDRAIAAILLGIVTYDANLLIIQPPCTRHGHAARR